MKWAKEAGLTAKSYVWIATQSVIGESFEALPDFPEGMLGKYFFYYRWTPKFDPNYVQIGMLCATHVQLLRNRCSAHEIGTYKCKLSLPKRPKIDLNQFAKYFTIEM